MASALSDLETPLLKVSRPVAACSRCRTAKIRCDGKLPACTACERAGKASSCPGAQDEFAKGKERSYVSSLESQVERLEKRLEEGRRRQRNAVLMEGSAFQNVPSISVSNGSDKARRKEASDIDDLVGDFGFLSVNATSRDFYGITSTASFAGLLLTIATAEPLPRLQTAVVLPPRSQASSLFQYYFDNVYLLLPFFVETSFWSSVDAVYQDEGRFASSYDRWLVHMVLAIVAASRSQFRNDRDSQGATSHVSAALRYSEDVLHPGSICGIQAILLLVQYSFLDPEHFRCWYLIGMASRVAADLGLHQEPTNFSDKAALDLRRRVFHCIHTLDRCVSMAFWRACSFTDDSVNVPLPTVASSTWQNKLFLRTIEPAIHLFKIRRIQSQAYQDMFFNDRREIPTALLETWQRCAEAQDWVQSVPGDLPSNVAILYRLEYLYSIISFLAPSNRDLKTCKLSSVLLFEYAVDYVSQISQLTSSWPQLLNYIDIQRVSTVMTQFLSALNQSHDEILHDIVPDPPDMPHGTHQPPFLPAGSRANSPARALQCIDNAKRIFEYSYKRWNVRDLLDNFQRKSAHLRETLSQQAGQMGRMVDSKIPNPNRC